MSIDGLDLVASGKVRDIYRVGDDKLLLVATDRISAFDVVLPTPIPGKGIILTQLSAWWFEQFADLVPNHMITAALDQFPAQLAPFADQLRGRAMLVRKLAMVPIECVVRGFLAGSGFKEYSRTGRIGDVALPTGLRNGSRLPEVLFTPSTKAETGHDENITVAQAAELVGAELTGKLQATSIAIYRRAAKLAAGRGIVLADTKFEFGLDDQGALVLGDEVLTPDSSRFWPADQYRPGEEQPSFDKQYVRDWLIERSGWDRTGPAPELPTEVVEATKARYLEAFERLTGRSLPLD